MFIGKKDNSRRKGIPAQKREKRHREAIARQKIYEALTIEQKIAKLDEGNFTATRQRHRLLMKQLKKR